MGRKTVYNQMVTSEDWEKVNKENKSLLEDFIAYKRSSDKSPNTIEQYFQVIRLFFVWDLQNCDNKFFVDMKKRDFVKFFNYMVTTMKSSPNRIATVKSILSSLSNYIENILDDEFEDFRNIVTKIEIVDKQAVREKTILTQEQVDAGLSRLVESGKYQVACFMALACASGARKSELLRFKVDYFKDENIVFGCLYETPEKIQTKGRSSRGKMLKKYTFVNQFKPYLDLWIKERERLGIDSEWLFVIKRGDSWEQASVHNANSWADIIGKYMSCDFYFHSLRHFWTTELKRKNLPDTVIQTLSGWASLDMVQLYSDLDVTELLGEYFDEDGVKTDIKVAKLTDI